MDTENKKHNLMIILRELHDGGVGRVVCNLSSELAKLNELLVVYGNKLSNLKRKIVIGICIILMILFIGAIYDSWCDIWHEFGENLYHMFNK